jgi:hypothetical protein
MVPGKTTTIATNDKNEWVVVNRDEHDFDFVPLVRMPHMPRTNDRGGRSAITQAIRSTTDSACRDLLALEVAREIYSVPGITLLGAAEKEFQNSDGTPKSAWDAYITRVRALEPNPRPARFRASTRCRSTTRRCSPRSSTCARPGSPRWSPRRRRTSGSTPRATRRPLTRSSSRRAPQQAGPTAAEDASARPWSRSCR